MICVGGFVFYFMCIVLAALVVGLVYIIWDTYRD